MNGQVFKFILLQKNGSNKEVHIFDDNKEDIDANSSNQKHPIPLYEDDNIENIKYEILRKIRSVSKKRRS